MQIVKGRLHNTGGPGLINPSSSRTPRSSWRAGRLPRYQETRDECSSCVDVELSLQRRGSGKQEKELEREKENMHNGQGAMDADFFGARNVTRPEKKLPNAVDIKDIQAAQREMFQTPHMHLLEAASRHERIFLAALSHGARRSGLSDACITNVMRTRATLQAV